MKSGTDIHGSHKRIEPTDPDLLNYHHPVKILISPVLWSITKYQTQSSFPSDCKNSKNNMKCGRASFSISLTMCFVSFADWRVHYN